MNAPEYIHCDVCGRMAIFRFRRKYPGKATPINVCGYHKRPYQTSQYSCVALEVPTHIYKKRPGYAPA